MRKICTIVHFGIVLSIIQLIRYFRTNEFHKLSHTDYIAAKCYNNCYKPETSDHFLPKYFHKQICEVFSQDSNNGKNSYIIWQT